MATTFTPTHVDSKLQSEWLFLHETVPKDKWYHLHGTAHTWLMMHHSLRRGQSELEHINQNYANQTLDWADYKRQLFTLADGHYGHLRGHHQLEDVSYFPKMRQYEPRLNAGFDILDQDHHFIESQLNQLRELFSQLRQNTDENPALADQLMKIIEDSGKNLNRHLADEEDLVIPVLEIFM